MVLDTTNLKFDKTCKKRKRLSGFGWFSFVDLAVLVCLSWQGDS